MRKYIQEDINVDTLSPYLKDIPIHILLDIKGNIATFDNATQAGKFLFEKGDTEATKFGSRVARNCLAAALGFDVNESGEVSDRYTGYNYEWDITYPNELPENLKDAYKENHLSVPVETLNILKDQDYANSFSDFILNNFDEKDLTNVTIQETNTEIVYPVSHYEVYQRTEDNPFIVKDRSGKIQNLVENIYFLKKAKGDKYNPENTIISKSDVTNIATQQAYIFCETFAEALRKDLIHVQALGFTGDDIIYTDAFEAKRYFKQTYNPEDDKIRYSVKALKGINNKLDAQGVKVIATSADVNHLADEKSHFRLPRYVLYDPNSRWIVDGR